MQKPKKVLITGGCGYVGSVLVKTLGRQLDGYVIRILDNLSGANVNALQIHLAAKANTPLSFDNPDMTRQVNQWGTTHLVDSCIEQEVDHLIFASSASVYGPGIEKTESDTPDPLGAYASSKLSAEQYIRSKKGQLDYTTFRIGTVYGSSPNMRAQAFVNRLCFLAGTKKKLTVFGDGEQVRPVIHLKDLCQLFVDTLETPENYRNETFNVCESNCTVLDVVKAIQQQKPDAKVAYTDQDIRTRYNYSIATNKIRQTAWQPEMGLEDGVGSVLSQFVGFESVNVSTGGLL